MTALDGRAVLVTGATGFIGSRLARRLVEDGAVVTGVGRDFDRVPGLRDMGMELLPLDLRDGEALPRAVEGKAAVFHAAAVLGADAETAEAVNVEATAALVRAAVEAGVAAFVHVSTVGANAAADLDVVPEDAPLAVDHPSTYPRTKARSEVRAREAAAGSDLRLSIVRPTMVYGPGPGVWTLGMARTVCRGKPVYLGDGSATFNPVYVDDVVDAMIRCATTDAAAGEAFNITDGLTTWRDFMGRYAELCGREPKGLPLWIARLLALAGRLPGVTAPVDANFIEMATARKRFPVEKARRLLGWEPVTGLDEGMARTLEWLREQGVGSED